MKIFGINSQKLNHIRQDKDNNGLLIKIPNYQCSNKNNHHIFNRPIHILFNRNNKILYNKKEITFKFDYNKI